VIDSESVGIVLERKAMREREGGKGRQVTGELWTGSTMHGV
jgi:hypothetical protein